jgi:tetratricopeptide (TPR) repeat protein
MGAEVHLRGTLSNTGSTVPNEFIVELRSASGQSFDTASATPSLNGQFEFSNVKPGNYVLSVKNRQGDSIKEEYFSANNSSSEVNIRLSDEMTEHVHGAGEGTVSVRRLNHQVPKAARKAVQRYRKCHEKSDLACEVKALDEAVAADPEYLEAYVNRSAFHARMRNWSAALLDIDVALKLDPNCVLAHSNRAFVAVYQKDYRQAIASANAALRTEPGNVGARYFRALAQVNLGEFDAGFKELERLAPEFEPARQSLAQAEPQRAQLAARKARKGLAASGFVKAE